MVLPVFPHFLFIFIFTLTEGEGIAFGSVCYLAKKIFFFDKYVDRLCVCLFVYLFVFVCPLASSLNRSTDRSEIFRLMSPNLRWSRVEVS